MSNLAEEILDFLEKAPAIHSAPVTGQGATTGGAAEVKVDVLRLPGTGGKLFGRETELQLLDNAWQDPNIQILSIIAFGGVGKSALINDWINRMRKDNFRGAKSVFAWSFYSQGTQDNRQVSADSFIDSALNWFGYRGEPLPSAHDKGVALANLIAADNHLLILDGLEPMQYPPGELGGKLKDQGLRALLRQLAMSRQGLCIITTRLAVKDIESYSGERYGGESESSGPAPRHELGPLSVAAGVDLLTAKGIKGPLPIEKRETEKRETEKSELEKAVTEHRGHALALNLLAGYLHTVYGGDIRQRDKIPSLYQDENAGSHAKNVMAAYGRWFAAHDKPELDILLLLGLFDRPATAAAVEVVKADPAIPGVTERLQTVDFAAWQAALSHLRELRLLSSVSPASPLSLGSAAGNPEAPPLDCHPLVREYFGEQLKQQNPQGFRAAHKRLYQYYQTLPQQLYNKALPDTLEEMEPLLIAVSHGCRAGLVQQTYDEVYFARIRRKNAYYLIRQLGAYDTYLSVLASFFARPWGQLHRGLDDQRKAVLLNNAGDALRGVGRLAEAVEPMQAALEFSKRDEDWKGAAIDANNLSELLLTLGQVAQAVDYGGQSVLYADKSADKSGDDFWPEASRTAHADALMQAGQIEAAAGLFAEAEGMQKQRQPDSHLHPQAHYLYSLWGFRYCDLLLAQGAVPQVLARAEQTLQWALDNNLALLTIALDQLTLGKALLQQAVTGDEAAADALWSRAAKWLHQAVTGLRQAGKQDYLPRGLLTRAEYLRHRGDYVAGWADLAEAAEIADYGQMRLHLVDYHLEACRMILAQLNTRPSSLPPTPPSTQTFTIRAHGQNQSLNRAQMRQAFAQHQQTATELIEKTGYHRRDKALAELTALAALTE